MAATDFTQWNTAWVADSTILHARLAAWEGQPTVALDTEFIRERTFWAQLALVQLAVPGEIVLADPLAPGICAVLGEFFARKGITWLMHAAGEDLQALRVSCGVVPEPLFDTQCAAALSGIGAGMSYQRLVEQVTGVALEKGETRSDWLRRPLSESQCRYAADDVRHLHAIHGDLSQRLAGLRRADWLAQECARQVANELDQQPEPRPHLALRSAQGLSGDGQWRLCRLLHWREVQARASDRPRTWILDNELAATLGLATVPRLLKGRCTLPQLNDVLSRQHSQFRQGTLEGIVIRRESTDWCEARAKLVRQDFTQAIGEHWSRRRIEWNRLG